MDDTTNENTANASGDDATNAAAINTVEMTIDERLQFYRDGQGSLHDAAIVERLDFAELQVAELTKERDAALADVDAAKKAGKVSRGSAPAKPRKLSSMGEDAPDADTIRAAISDAGTVEIAFSDGAREIAGLPPVIVQGEAWRDHFGRPMLTEKVTLHGPANGAASYTVDGYALILDGKPVAYTKRGTPLQIGTGQTVSVEADIYF